MVNRPRCEVRDGSCFPTLDDEAVKDGAPGTRRPGLRLGRSWDVGYGKSASLWVVRWLVLSHP